MASPVVAGLNPAQREAVLATEGPVLILAGAGSGKTRVITHRIAHLVLDKGVPSDRILAVTFTNKAAGEMKSRAEALLEGHAMRGWISTFHSLCVRILRREAAAAGLEPGFLIYDEADQLAVVKDVLKGLDLSEKLHPPRQILSRISARKNARRMGGGEEEGETWAAQVFGRVVAAYQAALRKAQALDFDDLLLRTVSLFDENEGVRDAYRRRFAYLLVDEYQDTNRVQYELVRHLSGPAGNLTVVGDEDQSIYSWRGADIQNILDFETDFPGARVLRLEENYRSSQIILDVASDLVANNRQRKGKTLRAVKGSGEQVRLHQASDEYGEAAWVVQRLSETRGHTAILYRMNSQSRLFEEALRRARIAYRLVGGVGFYERKEVKDVLAYLRLLTNPKDPVAFRRILNVPPRGIGTKTADEVARLAAERGVSPLEALDAVVDEALLPARAAQPLDRFRRILTNLREDAPHLTVRGLLQRILETTGYSAALAGEDSMESEDRLENLAELLSAAAEFDARTDRGSPAAFLDEVSLLSDGDMVREDADVSLMTLHAAKGLEFEAVFLVGLEEGLMPHARSTESEAGLEEERRLCYVGMTRAMDRLHLSWAESRQVFGQRRMSEPSRFLAEIPRHCVKHTSDLAGAPARNRPETRGQRPLFRPEPVRARAVEAPAQGDVPDMRPGTRVRHPLFGVGTVLRREGSGEDLKVTVSFAGAGSKRLVARYAGLEVL